MRILKHFESSENWPESTQGCHRVIVNYLELHYTELFGGGCALHSVLWSSLPTSARGRHLPTRVEKNAKAKIWQLCFKKECPNLTSERQKIDQKCDYHEKIADSGHFWRSSMMLLLGELPGP